MLLANLRTIKPTVKETVDGLEVIVVQPQLGDWIIVSSLLIISIPLAWVTTKDWLYFAICMMFYIGCAYTVLEDTFVVLFDSKSNQVSVKKSKLGWVHWIRVSNLDELVNIDVANIIEGRKECWRLELEFMSEFGFYKINAHESLLFGAENSSILKKLASSLSKKLKLQPLPEQFKKESIKQAFNRNTNT